ncbi:MAG: hypothetical protein QXM27_00020 [Candidatus Pacearchaeota archaeon]
MKNKKGVANNIIVWVTVLFFAAILLKVTLLVLLNIQSEMENDLGNDSRAYQAVDKTISIFLTIPDWFIIFIILVIAVIVIIILRSLHGMKEVAGLRLK